MRRKSSLQQPNKKVVKIVEEEVDEAENNENSLISKNVKSSAHSPFYYRLEALNEKIRLFKQVFYTNKRVEQKLRHQEMMKERHLKIMKDKLKK